MAVGRHVVDAQSNEIAAAQFAVYGEVEESQVACTPFQLQLGMDQPHVPGPERRLDLFILPLFQARGLAWAEGVKSFMVQSPWLRDFPAWDGSDQRLESTAASGLNLSGHGYPMLRGAGNVLTAADVRRSERR